MTIRRRNRPPRSVISGAGVKTSGSQRLGKARPAYQPLPGVAQSAEARREALLWIAGVWLASRVVLTAVGVFSRAMFGQVQEVSNVQLAGVGTGQSWLDIWSAWDSKWYYSIAEAGYQFNPATDGGLGSGYANYGFFPLYPWLSRLLGAPLDYLLSGDGIYLGGLLVSNLALLAGAWWLYRWLEQEKDRATAKKAVLFLMLFPTAYVFSCLMTEGLFVALSIGAWYYARRGNWMLAGILGGLSAMTRLVGLLVAPLLAWEYLRQQYGAAPARFSPALAVRRLLGAADLRFLYLGLVPAGLGVFMVVCWRVTGDPFAFVSVREAWHGRVGGLNPLHAMMLAVERSLPLIGTKDWAWGWGGIYGVAMSVGVFVLLIAGRKKIGAPLMLWSLALLLISISSALGGIWAMPRYLAVVFPLSLIFAAMPWRKWYFWTTAGMLALLQLLTWSQWTRGHPIAI